MGLKRQEGREHGSRKTIEFRKHWKVCNGAGKKQFTVPWATALFFLGSWEHGPHTESHYSQF